MAAPEQNANRTAGFTVPMLPQIPPRRQCLLHCVKGFSACLHIAIRGAAHLGRPVACKVTDAVVRHRLAAAVPGGRQTRLQWETTGQYYQITTSSAAAYITSEFVGYHPTMVARCSQLYLETDRRKALKISLSWRPPPLRCRRSFANDTAEAHQRHRTRR